MHARHTLGRKSLASVLSIATLMANAPFAYSAETNFWKQRSVLLAGLPTAALPISSPIPRSVAPLSVIPAKAGIQGSRILQKPVKGLDSRFCGNDGGVREALMSLPSAYGRVASVTLPKSGVAKQVVVHIQDVHLNAEAQRNIEKTVESVAASGRAGFIGLEGAFAPVDVAAFRSFPDRDAIKKTADYLLKVNHITGPVHGALTSTSSFPLIAGIDDAALHAANVQAFRESSERIVPEQKRLEKRRSKLAAEKRVAFNPALAEFDDAVERYRAGAMSIGDFAAELTTRMPGESTNVEIFMEGLALEKKLDFARVESERARLLADLLPKLGRASTEALTAQAVAYRAGEVRHADFYRYLKNLCAANGVALSRYAGMESYLQYVFLSDGIDGEKLFADIARLTERSYARLTTTDKERELIAEGKYLFLAGKLVEFSLTREEWKEYQSIIPTFVIPAKAGIQASNILQKQVNELDSRFRGNDGLGTFEDFYRRAEERDDVMAVNVLREISNSKHGFGIVVAGGFHAGGLAARLSDAGVAVVSYVPKITQVETTSGAQALGVFLQEKSSLEKIFEGPKLFLGQNPSNLALAPPLAGALMKMNGKLPPGNEHAAPVAVQNAVSTLVPSPNAIVIEKINGDRTAIREAILVKSADGRTVARYAVRFDLDPEGNIDGHAVEAAAPHFMEEIRELFSQLGVNAQSAAEEDLTAAALRHGLTKEGARNMLLPNRVIYLRLPVALDSGAVDVVEAYRVHHGDEDREAKGGVRVAKTASLSEVYKLAFTMSAKVDELGEKGGKGEIAMDAGKYKPSEIFRATRAYSRELTRLGLVGPGRDVPAPDMYTDTPHMAIFADEFIRVNLMLGKIPKKGFEDLEALISPELAASLTDPRKMALSDMNYPGQGTETPILDRYLKLVESGVFENQELISVVTGKPSDKGGLEARPPATGFGVYVAMRNAISYYGLKPRLKVETSSKDPVAGFTVAIQGVGNVGYPAAEELIQRGALVTQLGERDGVLVKQSGFTLSDIQEIQAHLKTKKGSAVAFGDFKPADPRIKYSKVNGYEVLFSPVDVVIPASIADQITYVRSFHVTAQLVVEGANGPTTKGAAHNLLKRKVIVVPDISANRGGVWMSYFELRNNQGLLPFNPDKQTALSKLDEAMTDYLRRLFDIAKERGLTLREAAWDMYVEAVLARKGKLFFEPSTRKPEEPKSGVHKLRGSLRRAIEFLAAIPTILSYMFPAARDLTQAPPLDLDKDGYKEVGQIGNPQHIVFEKAGSFVLVRSGIRFSWEQALSELVAYELATKVGVKMFPVRLVTLPDGSTRAGIFVPAEFEPLAFEPADKLGSRGHTEPVGNEKVRRVQSDLAKQNPILLDAGLGRLKLENWLPHLKDPRTFVGQDVLRYFLQAVDGKWDADRIWVHGDDAKEARFIGFGSAAMSGMNMALFNDYLNREKTVIQNQAPDVLKRLAGLSDRDIDALVGMVFTEERKTLQEEFGPAWEVVVAETKTQLRESRDTLKAALKLPPAIASANENEVALRLNALINGAPTSLGLAQTDLKDMSVDRLRWLMEQKTLDGVDAPLADILTEAGAKANAPLVIALREGQMPDQLGQFFDVVKKHNTNADGVIGKVIVVTDAPDKLAEIRKHGKVVPGLQVALKKSLFEAGGSTDRLMMAELRAAVLRVDNSLNVDSMRLVAPSGTERDFTGVPLDSPLRTATVIFLNDLLRAVELNSDVQQKMLKEAIALINA